MKLVDLKVTEFLDDLASKSPAPGGGSVAALSGSNGAALVLMIGALTTKKKKFKELSEEVQKEYKAVLKTFEVARYAFEKQVDEDTNAFNEVMTAYKLPKDTEEEITQRNMAIELATMGCIKIPMQVASLATSCLNDMEYIIKHSNRNTTSDQGVAVLMFYAAIMGAIMNVKINLPGVSQKDLVKHYKDVIIDISRKVNETKDKLLEEIDYLLE